LKFYVLKIFLSNLIWYGSLQGIIQRGSKNWRTTAHNRVHFQNVDAERAGESPVQNYSSDDSECIRVRSKGMRITDDDSN